ncbi:MAG: glycosyltransferase [Candidatus Nanoarchaeia archaeon]|nr:glycosyltransferase [Candidatus Nanoarchaeia archaeon]
MATEISIIIPTKNEEKHLPFLLKDIIKQEKLENYEIIVSDNNSTDKTRKIAEKFNCKIVDGGLPSKARNNGGKIAQGKFLVFFDADVRLISNTYIYDIINLMKRKKIECIIPTPKANTKNIFDKISFDIASLFIFITKPIYALSIGANIICTKKSFEKVRGFNENLIFAEDSNFTNSISKHFKTKTLISKRYYYDTRRLQKEGRMKYYFSSLKKTYNAIILNKKESYDFDIYNK